MTEVAIQYGTALYELARDESLVDPILEQCSVLAESFQAEPSFIQLLCSPSIPKEERSKMLDQSFRDKIHPYLLNFLKILTEKGYAKHFSGCCKVFRQHYNTDNGILPVTAVTAQPLSDALKDKLIKKLSAVTGKTIDLACRVEADCLGGVRLDFDGKQVDGTVRRRLEDIRSILSNTVL